jgi:hypothetical protein
LFSFVLVILSSECGIVLYVVLVRRCLIFRLVAVFVSFKFACFLRSKFSADSMTQTSSTLQIRRHEYSGHLNFIIPIVGLEIKLLYIINSDVVSLFADSSYLLVFSEFKYVIISNVVLFWFE